MLAEDTQKAFYPSHNSGYPLKKERRHNYVGRTCFYKSSDIIMIFVVDGQLSLLILVLNNHSMRHCHLISDLAIFNGYGFCRRWTVIVATSGSKQSLYAALSPNL